MSGRIVERLRDAAAGVLVAPHTLQRLSSEAADEIERLQNIAAVATHMRLTEWLNAGGSAEMHEEAQRYIQSPN
jgi:hypothetical protein